MSRRILLVASILALLFAGLLLKSTEAAPPTAPPRAQPFVRTITRGGTTSFHAAARGSAAVSQPELRDDPREGEAPINRNFSHANSTGFAPVARAATLSGQVQATASLNKSFDGLNHFQQRTANGGNQFSLEPPDQGLCAGNGFVMEVINDVLQVYNTSGTPLLNSGNAVDLNTFFGYKAAINRTTFKYGPFITDPSCYYDTDTQRWFLDVLTLDVKRNTGDFTGTNHLDLAVSTSNDPTGTWVTYTVPVQDDGTAGTPDHHCPLNNNRTGHGPCIGDYPHMGADANGLYLTTNEYPFFPTNNQFHGAQIYVFSKSALAANNSNVPVYQFDTAGLVDGKPGFTVWPGISPAGVYDGSQGGTEYFMSSNAAEEVQGKNFSNNLIVWAITNTSSLSSTPVLNLYNTVITVGGYATPPPSNQKKGSVPLAACLEHVACAKVVLGAADPFTREREFAIDSNDTRMQQVILANGVLWSALDTAVKVNGQNKAGIEYFIVEPTVSGSGVSANVDESDYLALANNNLTYPAVGVTTGGSAVMAFTVVGDDYYPSAGYTSVTLIGTGPVNIARNGVGPDDGFSGYKGFGNPPRPRWGDYGAAVEYNGHIWIASEYIGQVCNYTQFTTSTFTCGNTRTALANWDTRITDITP